MSKRVLIINDIPGAGKVASNISIPVLTASQLQLAILPTVLLSSQTGPYYSPPVKVKMGPAYKEFLKHWLNNQIVFDLILTGYFADPNQIKNLMACLGQMKDRPYPSKLIVDPVMADHGKFYQGFDQEFVKQYQTLLPQVDLLIPNVTEACLLSQTAYDDIKQPEDYERLVRKLADFGPKEIVLTGALNQTKDKIGFYYYNKSKDQSIFLGHQYFPVNFYGTGDFVAALLAGLSAYQVPLESGLEAIGQLVEEILQMTIKEQRPAKEGIAFEAFLGQIFQFFQDLKEQVSYEEQSNI